MSSAIFRPDGQDKQRKHDAHLFGLQPETDRGADLRADHAADDQEDRQRHVDRLVVIAWPITE